MSQLQQLRVFVNERLKAAAEEIFGAVERTLSELQRDVSVSQQDKESELLTRAEREERRQAEFSADSREGSRSGAEASSSTRPPLTEERQEHWTTQDLLEDAVVCLKHEQNTETSSSSQTQTVASGEGDLPPGTSTEWMRAEEEAEGCRGADCWQPVSSDSGDGADGSDAEWTESGESNSNTKTKKSKRKRQNSPNLKNKQSSNQRPLCCKLCGESFHYRSSLLRHVKSHANSTAILCPPNHAASAESGTEPSETHREDNLCYICGKTFTTRSHLKRHLLVHTGQKPHHCEECGRRFARGECLRIHMRIHTVEKPYTCEVCGKGFKQRSNMICHIRTHTGEKPHRCGICSRTFAYKKDMMRHMQGHAKM